MNTVKLNGIYKKYENTEVLKNISFSAKSGEIIGLVGPNGAGKSTLMKIITGMVKPEKGEVFVNEKSILKNPDQALKNIGAIIENPSFYNYLSGYENLMLRLRLNKNYKKDELNKIIDLIDLKEKINKKVKTYSLGMKQRLGIGYMLISNPKLMLLDEPTNGLDVDGVIEFRKMIKNIAKDNNTTVLISSHILSEIEKICDKVIFISHGEIVKESSMHTSTKKYKVKTSNNKLALTIVEKIENITECKIIAAEIFIETDIDTSKIVDNLIINNIGIYYFVENGKTLEDQYIKINSGVE